MSELALKLIRECKETRSTRLDLGNCGLTELPDELFELTWLEDLNFSLGYISFDFMEIKISISMTKNNGESNNIKYLNPKIENLKKLKILNLIGRFSAENQFQDLSPISNLQNLEQLFLSHIQISDLRPLENLKNLELLLIDNTQVSDLSPLKNIISLKYLDISNTKISTLNPLKKIINLKVFNASNTQIKDFAVLKNFHKLWQLGISNSKFTDLNLLSRCLHLKILFIGGNTHLVDLTPLKYLHELEKLSLSETPIVDLTPLKNLSNLKSLDISSTKVIDVSVLDELQNLQKIDVSDIRNRDLRQYVTMMKNGVEVTINGGLTILNDVYDFDKMDFKNN